VKILVAVVCIVTFGVGCGGGNGDGEQASPTRTTPEQDAGAYMKEVTERSLRGQYGRVWESLHPAHQAVVTRDRFDTCESQDEGGAGATRITVKVVDTYEEPVGIRGTDETADSTAVTLRFSYSNPLTGKPAEEHQTVHAIPVGGEWKWIFDAPSYNAYAKGECPEE
jgi:hypothetical protein